MTKINRKKQIRNLSILTAVLLIGIGGSLALVLPKTQSKPKETQETKSITPSYTPLSKAEYAKVGVNELGDVPIMMYHGIQNLTNDQTPYTGGNIDVDGYQRTAEAFRNDLQFYYENGYRMIPLIDYVNGTIDVEGGKSPIILTFDDGIENNMLVNGLDEKGNLIIDPNCAVGILEAFKKEHPDIPVTATFFLNEGLFSQPEYNEKILPWMIEHGYDIGNHTLHHPDLLTTSLEQTQEEVGGQYAILDQIVPDQYVPIVALPFGSPYDLEHPNMDAVFQGTYNDRPYTTKSALQVAWEANASPFSKTFEPRFLKRIRAYDNNGENFDIQMNFERLKTSRYVSDGDPDTIVYPESLQDMFNEQTKKKTIPYPDSMQKEE